ncbi:hypothetical protein ESY86_20365 [Subsaximicrobium wynnwilliamsii]|uniref:Uncharacterized protein n=1 Tax=Subsaximicrobium wynnwilliamsii TaxID=291179 RepID=A0A5C6ZBX6_9FLAO|nr:hypothetical protein [Subsaximicrobium wynnwilliamsii]TXD80630.1 hypothetical protein ESY87_20515 [Subsaximicrobium wynnwilliamsii]TXD86361.1 hypothetical protein ESY86_20365 [Subsaximicrobium wynnwilliamsii]TXD99742.1 hypothetical protein ESY88_20460 [Subsaximicrobium wynnwilliamsii]
MQTHHIRFIDNSYDLEIAEQLLSRIISQKIAFLEDRIKETDPDDEDELNQLKLRISDLNAECRSLDLLIKEHDGEYVEMEIGCTIVMSIKKIETT